MRFAIFFQIVGLLMIHDTAKTRSKTPQKHEVTFFLLLIYSTFVEKYKFDIIIAKYKR